MTEPTKADITAALEHGLWLVSLDEPLRGSDRMLADLAHGYQQVVVRLVESWSERDKLEAQLAAHKDTLEMVCTGGRLTCDDCQQTMPCMCGHKK